MKWLTLLLITTSVLAGELNSSISIESTRNDEDYKLNTLSGEHFWNKKNFVAYSFAKSTEDTTDEESSTSTQFSIGIGGITKKTEYKFSLARSADDDDTSSTSLRYDASVTKDDYWVKGQFTKFLFAFSVINNNIDVEVPENRKKPRFRNTTAGFGFSQPYNDWYSLTIYFEKYFYNSKTEDFIDIYNSRVNIINATPISGLSESILDISNDFTINDDWAYSLGLSSIKQKTSDETYTTISNSISYYWSDWQFTLKHDNYKASEDSDSDTKLTSFSMSYSY